VREKRETTGCSLLFFPKTSMRPPLKRYQVFYNLGLSDQNETNETKDETPYLIKWQEARVACQDLGGDLAEPSTSKEQFKIMAAMDKFPAGKGRMYWIGIEEKTAGAFWVSGKKLALNSGLKLTTYSQWDNDRGLNRCGAIINYGITDRDCDFGLVGYVCEFANEFDSPICIP